MATYTRRSAGKVSDANAVPEELLREVYSPVRLTVDEAPGKSIDGVDVSEGYRPSLISMWSAIWRANQLRLDYQKETGATYDWVLRVRPDTRFHPRTRIPWGSLDPRILHFGAGMRSSLRQRLKGARRHDPWRLQNVDKRLYETVRQYDVKFSGKTVREKPIPVTEHFAIGRGDLMNAYAHPWELLSNFIYDRIPGGVENSWTPFSPPVRKWHLPVPGENEVSLVTYSMWAYEVPVAELASVEYDFLR